MLSVIESHIHAYYRPTVGEVVALVQVAMVASRQASSPKLSRKFF